MMKRGSDPGQGEITDTADDSPATRSWRCRKKVGWSQSFVSRSSGPVRPWSLTGPTDLNLPKRVLFPPGGRLTMTHTYGALNHPARLQSRKCCSPPQTELARAVCFTGKGLTRECRSESKPKPESHWSPLLLRLVNPRVQPKVALHERVPCRIIRSAPVDPFFIGHPSPPLQKRQGVRSSGMAKTC